MTDSFIDRCKNIPNVDLGDELFGWAAPSNIALVKYWGKRDLQIPQNPSVSLTLKTCETKTAISFSQTNSETPCREFYFDGTRNDSFGKKALRLIEFFERDFPRLKDYDLKVFSENSFPHSSGIASSASSMASLSLTMMSLIKNIGHSIGQDEFTQKASHYARLGSGSACRSIFGGTVVWGESAGQNSNNEYAAEVDGVAEIFHSMRDSVLIVSAKEKPVSSTAGHALMEAHPFKEARYSNAKLNATKIIDLMRSGEINAWGDLVEREAMELHGLMMNGPESYILMKPNTLEVINRIRNFRREKGIPVFFTLDAGPNVHVLYPDEHHALVVSFIEKELVELCENGVWFDDQVGRGPYQLEGSL